MSSQVTAELFGWRKTDLEGKNGALLLPQPYSILTYMRTHGGPEALVKPVEVKRTDIASKQSTGQPGSCELHALGRQVCCACTPQAAEH